jgi:spore coat polysaccharide biosynthesis protein SpsF
MKILVIVQARTGSSRLPGKVLLPVAGVPLLTAMIGRVRAARTVFELTVATTWTAEDDVIASICNELGVDCYRGHPSDLLDRHYRVALQRKADVAVKIPSDCPLIDPSVIDRVLAHYVENAKSFDYVSNLHPASYPDGNDVEVIGFEALQTAFNEARHPFEREHTTPYIWERPERFRIGNVIWQSMSDHSMSHRFTIDYLEDYRFICRVFEELGGADRVFGLEEVIELLRRKPEILAINAKYAGVNWYRHHLDQLTQVGPAQTRSLES